MYEFIILDCEEKVRRKRLQQARKSLSKPKNKPKTRCRGDAYYTQSISQEQERYIEFYKKRNLEVREPVQQASKEYRKEYYLKNKEKILKYMKAYVKKNSAHCALYRKSYYYLNREKILGYGAAYRRAKKLKMIRGEFDGYRFILDY